MKRASITGLCAFLLATLTAYQLTFAASPSLTRIFPRGVQRGTEIVANFHGARLSDAAEILFFTPAITATDLKILNDGHVQARLHIAVDCPLGMHTLRCRTATGISELQTLYVGALPGIEEKEPNNEFTTPQVVTLNHTISGIVQSEDVDYYAFEAQEGQRISAEIEAMRLGVSIFDPAIAILNSARFELASSDDSALLLQDSSCQAVAPKSGTYYVVVRESSYGGGDSCHYRLHVGTFPRPLAAFPPGGKRGETTEIRYIGDARALQASIAVDANAGTELALFAEDEGGIAPSPTTFRVSDVPNVLEVEPNAGIDSATPATVPGAINGILQEPGDGDVFRFAAKKGQEFDFELYGRRLRSPIDALLRVHNPGGGQVAANDDSRGPDSYFRYMIPEDGDYTIWITDFLGKGGPDFVYRLEITPVRRELRLTIPRVAQYSQERQAIAVPRGNRYAALVSVERRDFGGELEIQSTRLPEGLTMTCEKVPADISSFPVLFEAKPDAPVSGLLCDLRGRHVDPSLGIHGGIYIPIDFLIGPPQQSIYLRHESRQLAVAVTDEAPFQIRIVEPHVPLVRNGAMNLKVVAERREGFDAPIELELVFVPPGVSAQRGVTIAAGATEAAIAINANGGAPIRTWQVVVNGKATVGNGPIWAATPFAELAVADPHIQIQAQGTSVELGQEVELFCKVQPISPFEGNATVELLGLPHNVVSKVLEVPHGAEAFSFPVKVAADSPPGHHKGIFCRVSITRDGETMVHSTGGTDLRIDKPLPPPPAPKAPPEEVAKVAKVEQPKPQPPPKPAPKKQLTRLEKVRLQYRENRQGGQ